jgi:hypothetical protein
MRKKREEERMYKLCSWKVNTRTNSTTEMSLLICCLKKKNQFSSPYLILHIQ